MIFSLNNLRILSSPAHQQQGGTTALEAAVTNGHLPVVQALVAAGANVQAADKVCVGISATT